MWMLPLYLHIYQKSDYDDDDMRANMVHSYDMKAVTKERSIAEKISRLLWKSNSVCLDKIQCSNN